MTSSLENHRANWSYVCLVTSPPPRRANGGGCILHQGKKRPQRVVFRTAAVRFGPPDAVIYAHAVGMAEGVFFTCQHEQWDFYLNIDTTSSCLFGSVGIHWQSSEQDIPVGLVGACVHPTNPVYRVSAERVLCSYGHSGECR